MLVQHCLHEVVVVLLRATVGHGWGSDNPVDGQPPVSQACDLDVSFHFLRNLVASQAVAEGRVTDPATTVQLRHHLTPEQCLLVSLAVSAVVPPLGRGASVTPWDLCLQEQRLLRRKLL